MVINIFLIFFSQISTALEFNFNSPESVVDSEEFLVSIDADTSDIYDVKIFVHEPIKEFSEIYDGSSWKSSHFYLKSIFPEKSDFKIRGYFQGKTLICARLRETETSSFEEFCNEITIKESNESEDSSGSGKSQEIQEEQLEEIPLKKIEETLTIKKEESIKNKTTPKPKQRIKSEKLILNSPIKQPTPQIQDHEVFTTKQEKTRIAIVYSFLAFCIFILILLSLKKL